MSVNHTSRCPHSGKGRQWSRRICSREGLNSSLPENVLLVRKFSSKNTKLARGVGLKNFYFGGI